MAPRKTWFPTTSRTEFSASRILRGVTGYCGGGGSIAPVIGVANTLLLPALSRVVPRSQANYILPTAFSITFTRWNSLWLNSIASQHRWGDTVSLQFRGDIILEHLQPAEGRLQSVPQMRQSGWFSYCVRQVHAN
jgi:hypothetical protein